MLLARAQPFPVKGMGCWVCQLWEGFVVLVPAKEPSTSHPGRLSRMVEAPDYQQEDQSPSLVFNQAEASPEIKAEDGMAWLRLSLWCQAQLRCSW